MIGTMKCAEFSKFMDYYKKKTHLSFYDYQNFMYATTMQFAQPLKMNAYEEWQNETGVTLVAVAIDDQKTINSVPVYVNGKGWEYLVLLDPNGDFKRAMGVNNVPHTFLVDKSGNIVYTHNNYAPGDEEKLYEEIKKLNR